MPGRGWGMRLGGKAAPGSSKRRGANRGSPSLSAFPHSQHLSRWIRTVPRGQEDGARREGRGGREVQQGHQPGAGSGLSAVIVSLLSASSLSWLPSNSNRSLSSFSWPLGPLSIFSPLPRRAPPPAFVLTVPAPVHLHLTTSYSHRKVPPSPPASQPPTCAPSSLTLAEHVLLQKRQLCTFLISLPHQRRTGRRTGMALGHRLRLGQGPAVSPLHLGDLSC